MANDDELALKFQVAQLEGRLALYETLITEISKLEVIERVAADVKFKLEVVATVWNKHNLGKDDVRGA